jgi:serine/threonine protein kinase
MNKYIFIEEIAKGTFGTIFKGQNILTKEYVAIKVALYRNNEYNNLKFEAKLYQYINRFSKKGFPKLKWYGTSEHNKYNFLVTELLGEPLTKSIGKLRFQNALNIGIQMIERIQQFHSLGLIHRDIKPDNFLFGLKDQNNKDTLYLIDYGFAKKFIDDNTGLHIKDKINNNNNNKLIKKSIIGTPKYISINIHSQIVEPSRRDDIESCLYIILELIQGKLIWDVNDIGQMIKIKKQIINSNLPKFFIDLLVYIRNLSFDEEPNYKMIIETLKSINI